MAEAADTHQSIDGEEKTALKVMDVETSETVQNPNPSEEHQSNGDEKLELNGDQPSTNTLNGDLKRTREDGNEPEEDDGASKKQKVEKSVEEVRLENLGQDDQNEEPQEKGEEGKKSGPVSLGPKTFSSSEDMFNYFYNFIHHWPPNLNVNKYEYMVLLDLLKKGHVEADKKIGGGVNAFQVRYHPIWKSRCVFLIRHNESVDDFSFRKCVDHILPLPDNMKPNSDASKALGGPHHKGRGGYGGGGGGGGGGRGSGGRRGGRGRGRGGGRSRY
ncbi:protein EMBRYO DEFECTIVE 514-like [Telopea speciosissima]|uniref:protein EMBRYO DEFECTIVE 514-like n=1 Tax=Telopea speciosissima TaxID=54955 RepID=UPI001CC80E73|nr:protein EMBRYO DEFECTIVE 514-like [Telopea speciosissima]